MTARVYVHIGPHKTGTTFLQQVLAINRQALDDCGVLFPGTVYREQREAVLTLLRRDGAAGGARPRDRWDDLTADVMSWPGEAAVISVENLDAAGPAKIAQLVQSFEGAEVHVIFTARDLSRVIPARWHTHMRNRASQSWQSYLEAVRGDAARSTGLWSGQDPRAVLARWEQHLPRDRIHVVTVPPPGSPPEVLWRRFCSVVGLDPALFSLEVPRRNESLGTAETELLRRINASVGDRISRSTYVRWVQTYIARRVLEQRPDQVKFALPAREHGWVRGRAEEIAAFLQDSQYEVVGDVQELLPGPPKEQRAAPDETSEQEVLDAAIDVISGLLIKIDEQPATPPRPTSPAHQEPSRAARMKASLRRRAPAKLVHILRSVWRRMRVR